MTLENKIESVKIQGFRSLADVELNDLPNAAVLIGPNGSGKSNFIRFFEMLRQMLRYRRLGQHIARQGGADDQLFGGSSYTRKMSGEIGMRFNDIRSDYRFALDYAFPDRFIFTQEEFRYIRDDQRKTQEALWIPLGNGHGEAKIVEAAQGADYPGVNQSRARAITNLLQNCPSFHFHDTSDSAGFRQYGEVEGNSRLLGDGSNLATVLHRLEQQDLRRYEYICKQIGRVLPGFDRFDIEDEDGIVMLRWKAKWSDKKIGAHLTSDGSLRFFALVTLLNLPPEMLPEVILLDEPELGLHPSAISLISAMIRVMSKQRQVIVATQSPLLVDEFEPDEIFVTELKDGQTTITRQDEEYLSVWLEEYSTGELWQKNVMGGRP